ncbi:precorrin-8X methylmutase [Sneathiella glossodoripedis]|uniref:precorrin-8X methylmutase n=1 Tax=Sneathiella glossodoripedis TaxID=418853 RepID=UPI0011DD9F87|nr:precorrin-8X methylmutase [Sneathiella glossodoripedis]
MYDYVKDPAAIYAQSFATVEAETDLDGLSPELRNMVIRIIHACGMPEIRKDLEFSNDIAKEAAIALGSGAPVLCDCEMVKNGITQKFLPRQNELVCTLNNEIVPDLAQKLNTTRSAAAVELWLPYLSGAVAVFGNAPTALFHLLELIENGAPKPAAILGFPVGFVGAAESKQALIEADLDIPFITIKGRKGGSAMAAAALNAAARDAT